MSNIPLHLHEQAKESGLILVDSYKSRKTGLRRVLFRFEDEEMLCDWGEAEFKALCKVRLDHASAEDNATVRNALQS